MYSRTALFVKKNVLFSFYKLIYIKNKLTKTECVVQKKKKFAAEMNGLAVLYVKKKKKKHSAVSNKAECFVCKILCKNGKTKKRNCLKIVISV